MGNMPDVLLLVGRLNYVWTNTESLLIYMIAHQLGVDKEAAIVVFLTLNTTRARIDLVERLAKRSATPPADRGFILDVMGRLKRVSRLRNKYNHSIYAFNEKGDIASTQLMRLVETDDSILYGKVEQMDQREMRQLEKGIAEIADISKMLWGFIHASPALKDAL
ncbi:hypothetical protein JQ506_24555 (plasmid) [Shinella sp. PSBB067]|uniref:hypothetical protein n=1 Tax=unclassified Shinella TaxID=2643062 RepID=UPI00193B71C5|nr:MULTISPECIES: hypothetical protein [unclassified Shinella]QRI66528.1 hypothetical protein JQ506_24555 [Shinella sp. PSBB067]